jgi:hypothetical protein
MTATKLSTPSDPQYSPSQTQANAARMVATGATTAGAGDLPAGWEQQHTPEGRAFFVDHNTRTTSWAKPNATRPRAAPPTHNQTSRQWFKHSAAQRINTDAVIVESLRQEYPQLHLTVVPSFNNNLLAYAAAGHAGIAPIDKEKDHLEWKVFLPPYTRLSGGRGVLAKSDKFAKYLLDWRGKEYVLYIVDGRDGADYFGVDYNQYILSPSIEASNQLLMEAGVWNNELHNEVWVFDQGYWDKSFELYESVMKASWDDVILDKRTKDSIISDVETFFNSRDTYEKLRVPWKRGIIYYGVYCGLPAIEPC